MILIICFDIKGEPHTMEFNTTGIALFTVIALYDFNAKDDDELSIEEDEVLDIVEIISQGWWEARNQKGGIGLVPDNYVELLSAGKINKSNQ